MKAMLSAANTAGKNGSPKGKSQKAQDTGPVLPLKLNGEKRSMPAADLLGPQKVDVLEEEGRQAKEPVVIDVGGLLELPDEERFAVLSFIAGIPHYRIPTGDVLQHDLFEATLALMVGHDDMGLYQSGKVAAIEAAILLYPEGLEGACDRIAKRLREL